MNKILLSILLVFIGAGRMCAQIEMDYVYVKTGGYDFDQGSISAAAAVVVNLNAGTTAFHYNLQIIDNAADLTYYTSTVTRDFYLTAHGEYNWSGGFTGEVKIMGSVSPGTMSAYDFEALGAQATFYCGMITLSNPWGYALGTILVDEVGDQMAQINGGAYQHAFPEPATIPSTPYLNGYTVSYYELSVGECVPVELGAVTVAAPGLVLIEISGYLFAVEP